MSGRLERQRDFGFLLEMWTMRESTQGGTNVKLPRAGARRYFLFVHYGVQRNEKKWERRRLTLIDSFYDRLRKDLQYLVDVLERDRNWEGRAFVFIDVGWTHLLKAPDVTAARTLAIDLDRIHNKIMEELCLTECDRDTCRERREQRVAPWPVPIQIITAADLIELLTIIDEMEEPSVRTNRSRLSQHLVGDVDTLRYDASKAIEGMIRVANVGRNVPIFRFDDDVIFYGQRVYESCLEKDKQGNPLYDKEGDPIHVKSWADLRDGGLLLDDMVRVLSLPKKCDPSSDDSQEQFKQQLKKWRGIQVKKTRDSILKLCTRYDHACANPKLHYFVFSGHYGEKGKSECDDLLNGYATRVVQLAELPKNPDDAKDSLKKATLNVQAARKFLDELVEIGANPKGQVISGAGLCLSDGAILDLPPYSNMRMNVMWIDDHLKYALHDELEHFDIHILEVGPAREVDAHFPQLRHATLPTYENVEWHLGEYMPRLLLGCIADAWLRQTSEMKKTILKGVLPPFLPGDFDKARQSREGKRPHVYAKAFLNAVPTRAGAKDAWDLHRTLWETGVRRLQELCKWWGHDDYRNTFLGLFLRGGAHDRGKDFQRYIHKHYAKGLTGAVTDMTGKTPYDIRADNDDVAKQLLQDESDCLDRLKLDDLSLENSLRVLIHDFVDYFETVGFWSRYVRAVRFLVNRSGRNRELQWLFPPDESYGESTKIEPIVHILEQLMDLHLNQKDFKSLVGKWKQSSGSDNAKGHDQQAATVPPENWCDLGQYKNERCPQVLVNASAIKSYARQKKCRADALWLIVTCYHFACAIVVRGHGHGVRVRPDVTLKDSHKFALAYAYFFLKSEEKRDALELLKDLAPAPLPPNVRGTTWKEQLDEVNRLLYGKN